MQPFLRKKVEFMRNYKPMPYSKYLFVQVDIGGHKNEYICAYMQKKKACKAGFLFCSIAWLRQIRPLFFSSSSMSVPRSFFSAIFSISRSAKLMSASMSGFLSSA